MTILALTLALTGQPSTAEPSPCPEGLIHVMPFCMTPDQYEQYLRPPPRPVAPGPPWGPLVAKYWPPHLHSWALKIIECESGGNPWAKNRRSSAAGLFQFLRSTWDRGPAPALGLPSYDSGAVYNPEWNIQAAAWLYANWGGKSQWSCKA